MNFSRWLLMIVVIVVDAVNGGVVLEEYRSETRCHGHEVGLEDCIETRCGPEEPAIRFPFRLQGRQPIHCGVRGFDVSCTDDNETILELPSSSAKLRVDWINYRSHAIRGRAYDGCLPRELFYSNGSYPFEFVGTATLFSCPPSTVRDEYCSSIDSCLARLSPCHGNNSGNHIYAVIASCYIHDMPLVSCIKVHDYTSDHAYLSDDEIRILNWPIPPCQHCEGRNHGRPNLKILGISALYFVLIAMGKTIYYVYNSNKKEKENRLRIERFLDDYRAMKPSRYSYADIKRITSQFKEKLGQGAYGTVFKGKLSSELLVAVKILHNSNENGEDFINEVGTMCQIHHVNVVRLVGVCADGFIRALVYEYLPNGSLQNFLSSVDNKNSFIGWDKLQDIALGIAKGIEYLHQGCDQRILHFDIKPHNVLLDQDFTPKVSDFGLAKFCAKDQSAISMTTARGTMGYIAPEIFSRNFGNVSYKSDVYSFGILLLEMVGSRKNFKVMEDSTSQVYFPEWIYNLLEQGNDLRIHIGDDEGDVTIARKLAIVGLWCIQWHPIDRPSMKVVVQMLEREGENLAMPPNPFASTSS
ncbi:rust resistance kinase Lr10-like isoform X2 [Prunus avium]|uniref:Rust resistance kinase Lr10-like isoform X1 n=1 Tax=Prunus avium TaxID=42229 RepID=A0A6P5RSF7_PRUAV|nr:rust resistance kinase Lr10-like isoform X1 [Prunus avium]XP_021805985.1 rust resistance kinase Lr10-like isoform X2 [Prunus avium]